MLIILAKSSGKSITNSMQLDLFTDSFTPPFHVSGVNCTTSSLTLVNLVPKSGVLDVVLLRNSFTVFRSNFGFTVSRLVYLSNTFNTLLN